MYYLIDSGISFRLLHNKMWNCLTHTVLIMTINQKSKNKEYYLHTDIYKYILA